MVQDDKSKLTWKKNLKKKKVYFTEIRKYLSKMS